MKRIVIIGSGGVAESFARAISRCEEYKLVQIYGRNISRVDAISREMGVQIYDSLRDANIYIVAVSDRAIGEVTSSLNIPHSAIVAHTAGGVDISQIPHPRRGVIYPLQSFTPGREVDMRVAPLFVEGADEEVTAEIEELARAISSRVKRMDSSTRKELHMCGVFASNFVNTIYGAAAEIAHDAGISFDLLKPLIQECCDKAIASDDPHKVQTGPAVRGDIATQEGHISLLKQKGEQGEELIEIYKILSKRIWETSKKM